MNTLAGTTTPAAIKNAAFQANADQTLERLRNALFELFDSAGHCVRKSLDAQKSLGIDANLSWQIFKLMGKSYSTSLAQYVPSAGPMHKLFTSARRLGWDPKRIEAADQAFLAFDDFVLRQAGDRTTFKSMMLATADDDDTRQSDVQHRKALFASHAHFWGSRLDTSYLLTVIGRNASDDAMLDIAFVTGLIQFCRLRATADTHVFGMFSKAEMNHSSARAPLDAAASGRYGAPVLPQFSTNALPLLETMTDAWGRANVRLAGDTIGHAGSVDVVFGEVVRNACRIDSPEAADIVVRSITVRPTRRLYLDILLDRRAVGEMRADVKLYGHASQVVPPQEHERDVWALPIRESVTRVASRDDARVPELPQRRAVLDYIFSRQGWSPEDFDLYRLHVEYPMLDTALVVRLSKLT